MQPLLLYLLKLITFNMDVEQLKKRVEKRMNQWFYMFWSFTIIHYTIGVVGIVASVTASATGNPTRRKIAGVISAFCIAVIGFIQPEKQYRKFVIAWRILDGKYMDFLAGAIDEKGLSEGLKEAENSLDKFESQTGNRTGTPNRVRQRQQAG